MWRWPPVNHRDNYYIRWQNDLLSQPYLFRPDVPYYHLASPFSMKNRHKLGHNFALLLRQEKLRSCHSPSEGVNSSGRFHCKGYSLKFATDSLLFQLTSFWQSGRPPSSIQVLEWALYFCLPTDCVLGWILWMIAYRFYLIIYRGARIFRSSIYDILAHFSFQLTHQMMFRSSPSVGEVAHVTIDCLSQ